jgi:hypothetical protein
MNTTVSEWVPLIPLRRMGAPLGGFSASIPEAPSKAGGLITMVSKKLGVGWDGEAIGWLADHIQPRVIRSGKVEPG